MPFSIVFMKTSKIASHKMLMDGDGLMRAKLKFRETGATALSGEVWPDVLFLPEQPPPAEREESLWGPRDRFRLHLPGWLHIPPSSPHYFAL